MPAVWWLALAGLSVFHQPLPDAPGEPAALAVADGRASLRMPCYRLVCADAEWLTPTRYTTLWKPEVPGSVPRLRPPKVSPLATRRYTSLSAPTMQHEWVDAEASHAKIDTTFGMRAFHRPGTDVKLELGTGYRLQPYAEYGTAAIGPIARGRLQLSQNFGDWGRLNQQVMVETGRRNTFVRQTIGVDIDLRPRLTLQSRVEMRHDTAANGGHGNTDTEGALRLRYVF